MTTPAITLRQVPEDLAVAMTWGWANGRLEFRFPHVRDEGAHLLRLADWLAENEDNATILAEWMQRVERAYVSDPLMQALDTTLAAKGLDL